MPRVLQIKTMETKRIFENERVWFSVLLLICSFLTQAQTQIWNPYPLPTTGLLSSSYCTTYLNECLLFMWTLMYHTGGTYCRSPQLPKQGCLRDSSCLGPGRAKSQCWGCGTSVVKFTKTTSDQSSPITGSTLTQNWMWTLRVPNQDSQIPKARNLASQVLRDPSGLIIPPKLLASFSRTSHVYPKAVHAAAVTNRLVSPQILTLYLAVNVFRHSAFNKVIRVYPLVSL